MTNVKKISTRSYSKKLSERTQESYWWHISDYQKFCRKEPESTGVEELRAYFQSMLTDWIYRSKLTPSER
ncbi:MAG: hypothetical protein HN704_09605 [Bacteroidetes bacterium]|nr:hypothetical protein [Bacteroidota bacterium]MBT7142593.1 hypothetical protein [Bacteroidota bacterium]MBT7491850.1 hypothetical protein [Bacteroidota bacterium]